MPPACLNGICLNWKRWQLIYDRCQLCYGDVRDHLTTPADSHKLLHRAFVLLGLASKFFRVIGHTLLAGFQFFFRILMHRIALLVRTVGEFKKQHNFAYVHELVSHSMKALEPS